ncbi:MAG: molybdopterin synthase catalytic subunit [Bradymonadia bacterium]|jgi:molybdopterin synthase catalytic subunit
MTEERSTVDISRYITRDPLDLQALLDETEDSGSGALAVFGGTVRELNEGRPVSGMTYDGHTSMGAKLLARLEAEAIQRFDVRRCRIMHRIGVLSLGETSVYVVVRSAHRASSFEAAKWAIDTLKEQLPVWKEEHYIDGDSRYLRGTPLDAEDDES